MSFKLHFQSPLLARLVSGIVLIDLLVVIVAAFSLARSFDNYQHRAEINVQNLTNVLAQNIDSTVDRVDLGLQIAAEEIERQIARDKPDTEALNRFLARLQKRLPWVIGLRSTDEQGWVNYGTDVPKDSKISLTDRLYFIEHRGHPNLGLFINKPVISRINKTWVINFARRLNFPDGRFAGVVFANISLENFSKMFAVVDVGQHGAINLRDQGISLIMRHPLPPDIADSVGKKDISPEFQAMIATGQTTGTFHTPVSFDHVARVVSYRKIDSLPMVVSVGLAEDDFLLEWRDEVLLTAGLVTLFILISALGCLLIARAWKKQLAIIEHLAHEEERFHTVADYPYDWEYWEGTDHQILYMSPSCERVTGYFSAAFIETPELLMQVIHADDRELLDRHPHDANHPRPTEMDFRIVRADGETRWISHCCQAVFGRDGRYIGHRVSNRDITDRHLFETEINRLAQAADQNPTGIMMTNLEGELTYTNMAYTRITGFAFGEMYGKPHRELIATEITDEEFNESRKFLAAGKIWRQVLRNRHKNGELRWEQIIASPIYDDSFKICNYLYLRTDISEQKAIQQQLQLLSYALDRVGETILLMGENDPHFIYVNQSAALNLGYGREELTGGMGIYDIDSGWSPAVWAEFWPALCTQQRMQFESTHRNRDGREFPVEITANYFEYDGKIYTLAICRDIGERKRAEDELHRLNRELRAISDCNQALMRADDERNLLDEICRIICDEAGYRMAWVGYAEHDDAKTVRPVAWAGAEDGYLSGAHITWSADNERGLGPVGIAVRSGETLHIQDIAADPRMAAWRDRALQHGYRSGVGLPLKDENAEVFGALMIYSSECHAITPAEIRLLEELAGDLAFGITVLRARIEHKRAEEELRRYKDQLEETVRQRTEELLRARDAAEAANKAKSVFLANMSHELRTPLNAILGFSGMMRRDPELTANQRENLDIINRSGEHLLNLINDVLEMSKIEAGRLQLEISPFDLGAMVRDVAEMMQIRAREKGQQLLLDQSSEFPRYIKSDEARIRQILINLINNAVKFTEQGGVTVRLGVMDNTRRRLLIEVEDTGPGIAPQDQQRLFEPFVQLTQASTQSGTGLGLTITRQFVRMLDGYIVVESTPGKGSLFRVIFPVEPAAPGDILTPRNKQYGQIAGLTPGQPRYRILIVEDQLENQLLLSRLMEELGLEVKIANNGEQCLRIFQDWRPDLIWMDRRMPVMDGLEATRRLRQLPDGQTVKIVAVTASAFKDQQQEMLDAGMDDFVRKPYRFEEIYDCLARQLGLEYIYHDDKTADHGEPVAITPAMLASLPAELRDSLTDALRNLDSERIAILILQIGEIDPALGQALSRLADYFDYPAILKLLDEAPGNRRE